MKILKLTKVKMGNDYPIIRITYKNFFGKKQRDAVRGLAFWVWVDTGKYCGYDEILTAFYKSSEYEYILN